MAKLEIKHTSVTPESKATAIPHPRVGSSYAPQAYEDPEEKGESISFIPSSKGVNTKTATQLPVKKP